MKPIGEVLLTKYTETLKKRSSKSRAKNYMQETAEKYLPYIAWSNKTLAKDMQVFWIAASRYYQTHTHYEFIKIMEWIASKNNLHPRAVIKLLLKK